MATAAWNDRSDPAVGARYTKVAITIHWLTAAAILYNLLSGLLHDTLPRGFFAFHISAGLTILILTVVRVGWKLSHKGPPFLPMKPWEATLARVVHFSLYTALLLMPLVGWAMVSANPPAGSPGAAYAASLKPEHAPAPVQARPGTQTTPAPEAKKRAAPMFWGLFPVPMIGPVKELGRTPDGVPGQRELHEELETLHGLGGWVLLFLLVLHIGGALKHQLVDREPELARMGLGSGRARARA